ncbi:MAG: glycosyltransferase family 9 protein [Elusimicrobia bacterium]|nr:glycosyltransferase family 9 protein [Elusimicrobiota bacterium]
MGMIRAEKFDLAFDLSLNAGIGLALKIAGIPRRVGYDYKGRGRFLTERRFLKGYVGRPVAEYYLNLLEEANVKRCMDQERLCFSSTSMRIYSSSDDISWALGFLKEHQLSDHSFIVLFPGGGASWGKGAVAKRWPAGHFSKLADKIIEKAGCKIILMGSPEEKSLCEEVSASLKDAALVVAGGVDLGRSVALLSHARFVIANDGGPLHMAVASGVQTVSIFGPVDPLVYGPFPGDGHLVVVKGLSCQPCYRNFRMSECQHGSCLKTLTVDEVFRRIIEGKLL